MVEAKDEANKLQADMHQLVELIQKDENNWRAYVDLVNLLATSENLVEAEELGLKSLALFKEDQVAQDNLHYTLGNVYYLAGSYERANEFFQLVTDEQLKYDAVMMQAQTWYNQQNYQKALVYALTGTEMPETDLAGFILLGNIWLSLENMEQAASAFEQALSFDENNFDANFGRGLIATVLKEASNPWFKRAQALDEKHFEQQAGQLDALTQIMMGNDTNE